jgi:protein-disulfide isomerase
VAKQQTQGGGSKWFYWVLGLVVLAGVGWLLTAGRSGGTTEELPPLSVAQTTGIAADPGAGVAIGPENAVVTIYDFSDYLCPHCRDFNAMVGKLLRRNYAVPGGPLRWVSYEFPLGDRSFPATVAAHCAEEQGKYWEMHDMLFAKVESWANETNPTGKFIEIAKEIGLDADKFQECLESGRMEARVKEDYQNGVAAGVSGTPGVIMVHHASGRLKPLAGAVPLANLQAAVDSLLEE